MQDHFLNTLNTIKTTHKDVDNCIEKITLHALPDHQRHQERIRENVNPSISSIRDNMPSLTDIHSLMCPTWLGILYGHIIFQSLFLS